MPAKKLPSGQATASETAPAFSIVGMYSDPVDEEFVRHVAILAENSVLEWKQPATVWYMGPPLVAGERSKKTPRADLQIPVHVVGSVPLDLDDREGIADWLEEVDKEPPPDNPFRRYIVRPHCDFYNAPETGRPLCRQFSCAGFVLECYRYIGVDLVNTKERDLPDVDFSMLVKAYPEIEREGVLARREITFDNLGIPGDGPWRIVLAGYIFHALDQIRGADPSSRTHTPQSVNEAYFPGPVP